MRKVIAKIKKVIAYQLSKPIVAKLLARKGNVKLNVGCGTDYKKGWINIDNNSDHNIVQGKLDLNWDLRYPLPFPESSVDFIFNEHFIEHLGVDEGQVAIRDLMRVLKPGGVMRIATPDLEYVVYKYTTLPIAKDTSLSKFSSLNNIKTKAERINAGFRFWGHKWLYDWEELERRLIEAGCAKMIRCELYKSIHKDLQNLETREGSTLIVEITKVEP